MTISSGPDILERVNRALGQVRAEYETDDDLYRRFAPPLYFRQLLGITPAFLVGGRGTGKTTTLRSMSFGGQARITGKLDPGSWDVVGAYWKLEPNVVSVFRGKGVSAEVWARIFSHYLNLKLSSLVIDYALWLDQQTQGISLKSHEIELFTRSLNLSPCNSLSELSKAIDLSLADVEARVNGRISTLIDIEMSILGRPIDYLFQGIEGLRLSQQRPFMFCLDEYENLDSNQQRLLNTLIKQVGGAPYTLKIGVRNTVAIDRATLIDQQPLQDPADFSTVDIVTDLKGESFEQFAATVVGQRLALIDPALTELGHLLPSLTIDEEADLLGAARLKDELTLGLASLEEATPEERRFAQSLSNLDASMVLLWARTHRESTIEVLRLAMAEPKRWRVRVGNYGYAILFAIRENRVGGRKYYAGWKTYCQLADGNIRYMIRLVYEALRLHVIGGRAVSASISMVDQTRAAARVGETTIRDLQGWSRQGAALTRLALGLGSIFGSLARELPLATPEVNQFRVSYAGSVVRTVDVDQLLGEAVGQGILLSFEGDKNARNSGATREMDYQLHPVLAPYFTYSSRRKRRMTIGADDIMSLTQRDRAAATVRRILNARGTESGDLPNQLVFGE